MTPDVLFSLGNIEVFWLILALAGGAFAAMIGANYAFGFTGVAVLAGVAILAGTGSSTFIDYVAFGPFFGPHISFAGGVAAAAYAAKKGIHPTGRDASYPLAGLNSPDVLLVGALFGAGGFVVQRLIALIPWFGSHTDSVALTVFLSGIAARVLFGKLPVFHAPTAPTAEACWLPWQEKPAQVFTISAFSALAAAGATLVAGAYIPNLAGSAHILTFGISAMCIFFVASGLTFPVTHHQTITAGLAAWTFYTITGSGIAGLLIGVVFGIVAGFVAEYAARMFNGHGDTHIDPPAAAIWPMNTLVALCALPFMG